MTRRRYYLAADTPESRPCSNYLRDRYREAPALYLRGDPEKLAALSGDVDIAPMNLQNVFVALCGHGDEG